MENPVKVHRPPADQLKRFIVHYYKTMEERVNVVETDNYYIIEQITTLRNSLTRHHFISITAFIYRMLTERIRPRLGFKLKNILVVNKYYGSLDALCSIYGRYNKLKLYCIGRPETIELLVDRYNPDVLVTIYPPFNIRQCRDKEIISFATSMHSDVYLCRLRKFIFRGNQYNKGES